MTLSRHLIKILLVAMIGVVAQACHPEIELRLFPDYDASFTINGEKTKYKEDYLPKFEAPYALYKHDGDGFLLYFTTYPLYLDTNKALSSFTFSIRLPEPPELGREYKITGNQSGDSEKEVVMCSMMWAPMCKFIDNPEIVAAHPNDRIILTSDTITEGWIRFDRFNYPFEDSEKFSVSFRLKAVVVGGDNNEVVMPVDVSKGKITFFRIRAYPMLTPEIHSLNLEKFVPKDYFMSSNPK